MSRWDETIVDGCPFGESGRLATSLTHDGRPSCPAAIGQFINHSNSDGNCIPISLDIKKSFLEICPYKPPVSVFSVGNAVARTDFVPAVAFVATRSIAAEEELLFNYNYRPSVDRTPSWYQR
jgi:SET domain-containing protein